jgi:hypothetical protein
MEEEKLLIRVAGKKKAEMGLDQIMKHNPDQPVQRRYPRRAMVFPKGALNWREAMETMISSTQAGEFTAKKSIKCKRVNSH